MSLQKTLSALAGADATLHALFAQVRAPGPRGDHQVEWLPFGETPRLWDPIQVKGRM